MAEQPRPLLKLSLKAWGYSNYGVLIGIAATKKKAIAKAEKMTGEPWDKCKAYMEVRKVRIVEGWEES